MRQRESRERHLHRLPETTDSMSETDPLVKPRSPRGERLVAAWNRKDISSVLNDFDDKIILETRYPKTMKSIDAQKIFSRADFEGLLEEYRGILPHFEVVSATEDPHTILLTLEDSGRDVIVITLELNDANKIERIISYRSRGASSE